MQITLNLHLGIYAEFDKLSLNKLNSSGFLGLKRWVLIIYIEQDWNKLGLSCAKNSSARPFEFVKYLRNLETDFKTIFFFWKLRFIWQFWIQNHFCTILGGWDIFKTKLGSEIDKFIFKLTWSGPHSTRMALRCSNWPLTGLVIPWGTQSCQNWSLKGYLGQSGAIQGILRPVWHC